MPIDASIPLGVKTPDTMQQLSGLLNVANGAQTLQQNKQATQQGSIDLQERQGMQQFLSDPSNYTDETGAMDMNKFQGGIAKYAPTTGFKYMQAAAAAQKAHTDAMQAVNNLSTDNRQHIGAVLASLPADAPQDLVAKTIDSLRTQYKGIGPAADVFMSGYKSAAQQGPDAAHNFVLQQARGVLPQPTQQEMSTPNVVPVSDNQHTYGINTKPGVPNLPVGSVVPGTSVQMQLPPTTPTVHPATNQPGYVGPQGTPPAPGAVPPAPAATPGGAQPADNDQAAIFRNELAKEQDKLQNPQKYMSPMEAQADPGAAQFRARAQQNIAGIQREMASLHIQPQGQPQGGFVPSGPVPGANESKGGTVQTMNQHWDTLNKTSENSQLLEGLLGNIKSLAPGAITGTEAGRKAYLNGLLNALHLGNQATGDLQKDTDLLEKNIAQLGLNTPAATDAMRTIVGAARPHGTMSTGAIEEAAAQLTGQIQANRAVRNALAAPKQIADQTGDPSVYQAVRQHIEEVADPRAWQFQNLSPEGRKSMLAKLTPEDRAALRTKIEALTKQGLLK